MMSISVRAARELMTLGQEQASLAGISGILKKLSDSVGAYSCVLWEMASDSAPANEAQRGRVFVLAAWFPDSQLLVHKLPLASTIGRCIVEQRTVISSEPFPPETSEEELLFLREVGIRSCCSVPVTLEENRAGAISICWNRSVTLTKSRVLGIEDISNVLAGVFGAITNRIALKLLEQVSSLTQNPPSSSITNTDLQHEEVKNVLEAICAYVAETFQCLQASVFLEDRLDSPGVFRLMATTWPEEVSKETYYSKESNSLTGWVLRNARPIYLFDLAHFDQDREEINRRYPGLMWSKSFDVEASARRHLELPPEEKLPPLSFMAAPVLEGQKVLGVLRCSVPKGGRPHYFSHQALNLLTIVAAQVGGYWNQHLRRLEVEAENRMWGSLSKSIIKLNNFAYSELRKSMPDESAIFDETLKIVDSVMKTADSLDVRLLDEKRQDLYFARTHGRGWNRGDQRAIQKQIGKRFPVGPKPALSVGAYVFQSQQTHLISDIKQDPYYDSETFADIKRMIVSPISVENKRYGVLDIRWDEKHEFPRHSANVAALMASQLGLYRYLATTMRELRTTKRAQTQTFEDLEHQLISPLVQAYMRLSIMLRSPVLSDSTETQLLAIRGLLGKAKRVAMSTGLFAVLAREQTVKVERKPLGYDDIVKILVESAIDNQLLVDPERRIRIQVHRKSFEVLDSIRIEVDHDLVIQSVNNLLDNAVKYSYPRTEVSVSGGLIGNQWFHITMVNQGTPIEPDEVPRVTERGYRGKRAKHQTGEGSGIGLWLVEHIMSAHDGKLVIKPSTSAGVTEIKLLFPYSKSLRT